MMATDSTSRTRVPGTSILSSRRYGQGLLGLLILVAGALTIGGYQYLSHLQAEARGAAREALSAIADLKLHEISAWREERMSDARFFSSARFAAQDLRRLLDEPNSEEGRSAVLNWLRLLKGGERYAEVVVFDARGERRLALSSTNTDVPASLRGAIQRAMQARATVITDLHQDTPNSRIELDIVFPVFEEADFRAGKVIGTVLLKVDARHFLFPLIQAWPTRSRTAETLLIRREADDVVYLNDLRHRKGAALTLRVPVSSPNLPAAKVLRGDTQVLDGVDYRGVPVVAAGRLIPGTSWGMVAKIDQEELYAPLRQRVFMVVFLLATLLMAAALLVAFLWRHRNNQFLRRELALEKERAGLAERVAQLMRNANDIVLFISPQGRILEGNESALKSYGYSLGELQQKTVVDLRPPETAAGAVLDLERINAQGTLFFETVHGRKDGSTFPVEVSSRKIRVGDEDIILSIVRDITQRKAHESEIERLNCLYAALSELNAAVVRARTREELLAEVCRALVQAGGFEMAWIGWVDAATSRVTPLAQFGDEAGYLQEVQVFADERPEGQGPMGCAIREGRPCVYNDILCDSDLAPRREAAARSGWASVAAFPIRQEGSIRGGLEVYAGQKEFFGARERALVEEAAADVSFGLDILLNEQRRQAGEERLKSQAAALASAANSIVITGVDGTIQWVNPAFERCTGYGAAEVVGKNPRLLNSGRQDAAFFKAMWEKILGAQVWHGELINRRKDGTLYTEDMTITPVKDETGAVVQFVAIKQDVTARRQAEEAVRQARDELARANADLERRVQERTVQLREMVAELEAFSYSLSHDLRSPLRAIKSFSALVMDEYREKLVGGGAEMLEKVVGAADRMDQLVTDVLALSHVSRDQIRIQPVATESLVRQIVQERPELQSPKSEVRIDSLAPVLAHEALLTQCLTNLLTNAVKFVAPGMKPQVRVRTQTEGTTVRLWVEDNGIGIPAEAQEKIFGIFERLHSRQAYEGTGIGLAIVKRAVERMGGRLGVESESGQGSRFWIELQKA